MEQLRIGEKQRRIPAKQGMSLDGELLVSATAEDKALAGPLEVAVIRWTQTGQMEAFAPLLDAMNAAGKLAKLVRAAARVPVA